MAIKDALYGGRADFASAPAPYFSMNSPATVENIRMHVGDSFTTAQSGSKR